MAGKSHTLGYVDAVNPSCFFTMKIKHKSPTTGFRYIQLNILRVFMDETALNAEIPIYGVPHGWLYITIRNPTDSTAQGKGVPKAMKLDGSHDKLMQCN